MTAAVRPTHLLLLAAVLAAPATARADAKAEAAAHVQKAMAFHADHKLTEALLELNTAYTLDPQPDLLYAIAQTHVQLGDCAQAITFYERFLSTNPEAVAEAAAREAIDTCQHQPPPATDPSTGTDPTGTDHPPAGATEPPAGADGEAPPTGPIEVTAPVARGPRPWYRDPLGMSLVGGGLALGAVGTVTYYVARADLADAESSATYGGYADGVDRARRKRLIAGGLGVAGAVLVGVGAVTLWHAHGRETQVSAAPTSGGGLVVLGGAW